MSLKVFQNNQLVDIEGISISEKTDEIKPYLDGKTRLWIEIPNDDRTVHLRLGVNGTAVINWGDGTATTSVTGTKISTYQVIDHAYASGGRYIISFTITGQIGFAGDSYGGCRIFVPDSSYTIGNERFSYANRIIKAVESGDNTALANLALDGLLLDMLAIYGNNISIDSSAVSSCTPLDLYMDMPTPVDVDTSQARKIAFGNKVTTFSVNRLTNCTKVTDIVIPVNVASFGNNAFRNNFFKTITFKPTVPPTFSSNTIFVDANPNRLTIRVPRGYLEAYTTAASYPDPNTFTYEEYDP